MGSPRVYEPQALEAEVDALLSANGLADVQIEVRPDPVHDRRHWVVAHAHL